MKVKFDGKREMWKETCISVLNTPSPLFKWMLWVEEGLFQESMKEHRHERKNSQVVPILVIPPVPSLVIPILFYLLLLRRYTRDWVLGPLCRSHKLFTWIAIVSLSIGTNPQWIGGSNCIHFVWNECLKHSFWRHKRGCISSECSAS